MNKDYQKYLEKKKKINKEIIRRYNEEKLSYNDLARIYNLTPTRIGQIIHKTKNK